MFRDFEYAVGSREERSLKRLEDLRSLGHGDAHRPGFRRQAVNEGMSRLFQMQGLQLLVQSDFK